MGEESRTQAFRIVTRFQCQTFQEALELPPRPNAEGIVVHFTDLDKRLKIKQADYVALHRILTNTTERTIWEFLVVAACKDLIPADKPKHWGSLLGLDPARAVEILEAGDKWMDLLLKDVPDEFYTWVHATVEKLTKAAEDYKVKVTAEGLRLKEENPDRRDFARKVSGTALGGLLFQVYDGRDITTQAWRAIYPPPGKPFFAASEDVA